jgi:putative DNA methylase
MNRKLIEVAIPLEAISIACRRDKDRKTGTIKNVHKWFAPMPTPAWRALLFAAIVDDPGEGAERDRLLGLITRLVPDDGMAPSQAVLEEAREILVGTGPLPLVVDPFCGGGSTVIEAQRLGLEAAGSDLNPVPVLITKVLCDLVPKVMGRPALSGGSALAGTTSHLDGLLQDVRSYADFVRDVALKQVGHLYAPAETGVPIAWLWARTIECPNPACRTTIPLYSSEWLSKKKGSECWLDPVVENRRVVFRLGLGRGRPPAATKVGRGAKFRCPACGHVVPDDHVKAEGIAGRMGVQLMATAVGLPGGGRGFEPAVGGDEIAALPPPEDIPSDVLLPEDSRAMWCYLYGVASQADVYTSRQLHVLNAFSDAVAALPERIRADGGDEATVEAITAVLALAVAKLAMSNSTQVRWRTREGPPKAEPAFGRQALPMMWDFAETNPFADSVGGWTVATESLLSGLKALPPVHEPATVTQLDARSAAAAIEPGSALVATDPPYFSHIGYADLSDYFYVWHRRCLRQLFPELYGTIATPKSQELIAAPYRHGGDANEAHRYFVNGYTDVFQQLSRCQRSDLPMIVVYAHRQEDNEEGGLTSAGWDAMLEALLAGGLGVVGTWPIHATSSSRQIGQGTNALASYIVLVCRPRDVNAGITDRQGFVRALRSELPGAIRALQDADTLPFDLTQAAIGPGMAIFSRFSRIVEPDGDPMRVRDAISLINQVRSAVLSEQDDEFDADTRWAIQWFERYGFDSGPFGEAEKLFTATATSLERLRRTGIIGTKAPDVWLLGPEALSSDWDPVTDIKTCTWEVTMHLLRVLHHGGGESEAARILAKVDHFGDLARDLAYRLADVCETTRRTTTALAVNGLIAAWPEISRQAAMAPTPSQESLL